MAKDLTVQLEHDQPGEFSRVAEALGAAGINIDGVAEVEGLAHVLVEDASAARAALEGAGLSVAYEHEVVVVQMEDKPGDLARVTQRVAEAGVNLRFAYLATDTRLVLGAHDLEGLRKALG